MSSGNEPPFLGLKFSNFPREKWLLIGKFMAIYCIVAPVVILIIYLSGNLAINAYKSAHKEYFYPINKFYSFFWVNVWPSSVVEEIESRGSIWLLGISGFTLTIRRRKLDLLLVWLAILIPDLYWALAHSVLSLPIFAAGIGWGYLVYKTKSLWPAIIAHASANILIYFFIKFAGLFVKL